MCTNTVSHLIQLIHKIQVTMSKLYHEGKFDDKLSNEFFERYESAERIKEYHKKILKANEPLNY